MVLASRAIRERALLWSGRVCGVVCMLIVVCVYRICYHDSSILEMIDISSLPGVVRLRSCPASPYHAPTVL